MRTIWKWRLSSLPVQSTLMAPKGSKPFKALKPADGHSGIDVYMEVPDSEARKVSYHILVVGTGWDVDAAKPEGVGPHQMHYLGTIVEGPLVWHVYHLERM